MAGQALLALGDTAGAAAIRTRILNRHHSHGRWQPFWWHSDVYVIAHSLTFLVRTGGIPAPIAEAERYRLATVAGPMGSRLNAPSESSFDTAQRLIASAHLHAAEQVDPLRHVLASSQCTDGGWPASFGLLVPQQRDPAIRPVFADDRRLISTAMALLGLVAASGYCRIL